MGNVRFKNTGSTNPAPFLEYSYMIKPLSEVTRDAMELPVEQRLSLVRTILGMTESHPAPSYEVDQAWEDEIADRIQAVQSGQATGRTWDEILKDIDTQLSA